jgi:hypothetical protein
MRRGYKGIYRGKEFTLGLVVEFGAVALIVVVGYIICSILIGW